MKFRKFLQTVFKKTFQFLFKLLYGTIKLNNLENLKKVKKNEITNIKSDIPNSKDYYSYKIFNGRVYTDCIENVAIISENNLINEISYQQVSGNLVDASQNIVLRNGTPKIKKNFKGRVLCVLQGASGNNYSHWILEILPKIKMYLEHYSLADLDYIYLPKIDIFQKETLSVLGIHENKFISSEKYRHIEADELIVVDHTYYYKGTILEQNKNQPTWVIEWLRKTFLNCEKKFDCQKLFLIDRSDSKYKHNQIQNRVEVSDYLNKNNFVSYKLENLSFFEKVYLFKNASIIIGVHGAGFVNTVFCKPGTKIIEIRPFLYPNTVYERISNINNLNYHLIQTETLKENKRINGDINLPLDKLDISLNK
jgi:capsular polysaccharide biosynthesis protein